MRSTSPSLMVRAVVNAAQANRLPDVDASKMPAQPIDPQLPPLAAANSFISLTLGLTIDASDVVTIYASSADMSFNAGVGAFQRSSIRMKINRGDWEGAADALLLYCMGGGKILAGLKKRRDAEKALFLS